MAHRKLEVHRTIEVGRQQKQEYEITAPFSSAKGTGHIPERIEMGNPVMAIVWFLVAVAAALLAILMIAAIVSGPPKKTSHSQREAEWKQQQKEREKAPQPQLRGERAIGTPSDLSIPRQVASPQSLPPFPQADRSLYEAYAPGQLLYPAAGWSYYDVPSYMYPVSYLYADWAAYEIPYHWTPEPCLQNPGVWGWPHDSGKEPKRDSLRHARF